MKMNNEQRIEKLQRKIVEELKREKPNINRVLSLQQTQKRFLMRE